MDIFPVPSNPEQKDSAASQALALASQAANRSAASYLLEDYRRSKAANTLIRHACDLARFARFLTEVGQETERHEAQLGAGLLAAADRMAHFAAGLSDLQTPLDPEAWRGVAWGLVAKFKEWLLDKGFAVATINKSIGTVRIYAEKVTQAGVIDKGELLMIRTISGYKSGEGRRVDEKRERTRRGHKKATAVLPTISQAEMMKGEQPDTPQGRRDALLMCLLLDHGLRASEVVVLTVESIDLEAEELYIFRTKTNSSGTHKLTRDTLAAARRYYEKDAPEEGLLLRGSRKGRAGQLTIARMGTTRAITARVRRLAKRVGVKRMSAHDCRHYAATYLSKEKKKGVNELMDIFGWDSPAMATGYVERAQVVELD